MGLKAFLVERKTGKSLHSASPHDDNACLVTTDYFEAHGTFKSTAFATAQTVDVSSPDLGGALVVTSILMRAAKKNAGTVTLQFDDGTNTEAIFGPALLTNAELTLAFSIPSGWKAWKDATLQVVTNSDFIVSVTVGYAKIPVGEDFGSWDAAR